MIQSSIETADKELKDSNPTNKEITSQQLFNHLFEACNILRGPINQDEYKSYVTPILFFKRISDVYDEETQDALERSGGDEEYARFPENHSFDIPEGCHWKDVREVSENVGVAIVNAMNGIERANPDTLSGVFSSFDDANWTDKTKLSDERLNPDLARVGYYSAFFCKTKPFLSRWVHQEGVLAGSAVNLLT